MRLPFDPVKIVQAKVAGNVRRPQFAYDDVVKGMTWACVDLGAFPRPLPELKGIDGVVIMEDRDPDFFLSFRHYESWALTRLNRHGPLRNWVTHHDLKKLVGDLHDQNIKVAMGFWNYAGWGLGLLSKARFFRQHPELFRIKGSSDLYPFVVLQKEGIEYSEYIAHQYRKLQETFGFDGLMLGDGFGGFRSFLDPDLYRDKEDMIPRWAEFYNVVGDAAHLAKGLLMAYDCMGYSASEARRHGIDYTELARAGLDILIYQSYPQAWGEYWLSGFRDKFDLEANEINLRSVKKALKDTKTKVLYSFELGDSVEKWWANPAQTKKQVEKLDPIADGRFLVWANDLFANPQNKD